MNKIAFNKPTVTELQKITQKAKLAIQNLRKRKFLDGHPFMIQTPELPNNQVYLEYASGNIHLVEIKYGARDFTFLRDLTIEEANLIRQRYHIL